MPSLPRAFHARSALAIADEGRVQCSAAAFTKGLLDLEGASLTPILVSLVKKDARMLDVFEASGRGRRVDGCKGDRRLRHVPA